MHTTVDTRVVRCLDALTLSFQMLARLYEGLSECCAGIKDDHSQLASAFMRCWSFVDTVYRLREVVHATPGLSGKAPEVRTFLQATVVAETFRHYIQHLRSELSKVPGNPFPVWGS